MIHYLLDRGDNRYVDGIAHPEDRQRRLGRLRRERIRASIAGCLAFALLVISLAGSDRYLWLAVILLLLAGIDYLHAQAEARVIRMVFPDSSPGPQSRSDGA
jgi:hypothetical protein